MNWWLFQSEINSETICQTLGQWLSYSIFSFLDLPFPSDPLSTVPIFCLWIYEVVPSSSTASWMLYRRCPSPLFHNQLVSLPLKSRNLALKDHLLRHFHRLNHWHYHDFDLLWKVHYPVSEDRKSASYCSHFQNRWSFCEYAPITVFWVIFCCELIYGTSFCCTCFPLVCDFFARVLMNLSYFWLMIICLSCSQISAYQTSSSCQVPQKASYPSLYYSGMSSQMCGDRPPLLCSWPSPTRSYTSATFAFSSQINCRPSSTFWGTRFPRAMSATRCPSPAHG